MKHSAYRSMTLAKEGKTKPDPDKGLKRWINEKWINLSPVVAGITSLKNAPACGDSSKNPPGQKSICRPSIHVNEKTPKLASSYTMAQLRKAQQLKNKGLTIKWSIL